ncbi:EF-P lysine aminoacylase GenX [Candidatus Falkowbacteria bacterium RIFOXYB2_FULL_38_15]|uniref:EF-P lysine aminoacylase GenX n=1 Tax=Candidatus Falkowbacteria bacterium RIFOXYA2_FULL_38_12 TaxID=1797993 RepID=A0A1F5S418_9BACT|nr:MAG: EF-P lysine aminoacylase GenX [Candidatus Falkowbacteria bacterium RIFOXYA2_FULL_38_12]OGF32635.1 MAG: EF-P lysine aminoacylase GenX [Candidatus Falkowbacteria bacterium RIFOXYB2_FULL_38_15]OGF44610.1 MAG: EF-P lysine aminoacylase GenX [Candidatus Falkowbacteria bacterium RIFOXYD2_FULL_39_16]
MRAKIIALIRDFFYKEGFLEVETPSMVAFPGMEPYLDPMKVSLNLLEEKNIPASLITSPEYAMKKILAGGFSKIFQICKSFRAGEAIDSLHNPEFTILEWYRTHADYKDIMNDFEGLMAHVARGVTDLKIKYQGSEIDLAPPWERLTMREAFQKYAKMNLDEVLDRESIERVVKEKGYEVYPNDSFDDIFFKIFLSEIEPHLGKNKPTILMDWPRQMAALSKVKADDPRYAERFEVYAGGMELGNAFTELIDPDEQRERLQKDKESRKKMGKDIYEIDEDFIDALRSGFPPAGGIAVGVDRIVMLFLDTKNIEDVLFFPARQIFNL